jgi:hypothetical protein
MLSANELRQLELGDTLDVGPFFPGLCDEQLRLSLLMRIPADPGQELQGFRFVLSVFGVEIGERSCTLVDGKPVWSETVLP